MKIIEKNFNLIPNCNKFKLGGKYDNSIAYKALGFNSNIAKYKIKFQIEDKIYSLKFFLEVSGFLEVEILKNKYTKRKCEELKLDVEDLERDINKQKAKKDEVKLLLKFDHKDCIELINSPYFKSNAYLKKYNIDGSVELIDINHIGNFSSVEEFYEYCNNDNLLEDYLKYI